MSQRNWMLIACLLLSLLLGPLSYAREVSFREKPQNFDKSKTGSVVGFWQRTSFFSWNETRITKVNDKKVLKSSQSIVLYVDPGQHTIIVQASFNKNFWSGPYYVTVQIPLTVKQGNKYVAKQAVNGDQIDVWFEENGKQITRIYSAKYEVLTNDSPQFVPMKSSYSSTKH